jgi:thiol:disulfide interchange protein DsbA
VKLIRQLFALLFLLCAVPVFAEIQAGKDYTVLTNPQPTHTGSKVEVIEFFFYGCSHCYRLNPLIGDWEKKAPKDVELVYVPAIFNPTWEVSARTFYALESLGVRKQLHNDLFNAWNSNIELVDEESTEKFLAGHGVDPQKFRDAYNSFSMQSNVMRARQQGQVFGIRGTPTLIVDGKYLITGLVPQETIRVLTELVDKARKEHKK